MVSKSTAGRIIHTNEKTNMQLLHTRNCWGSVGHINYFPLPMRKQVTNILKDVCPPGRGPRSQFPGAKFANYTLETCYNFVHFRPLGRVILYHVVDKRSKEIKAWVSTNGCQSVVTLKPSE